MIILHVLIAVLSLVTISMTLVRPAKKTFVVSYGLVSGTILTGVLLVLQTPAHMMQVCVSGLIYTVFASLGLVIAHARFARGLTKVRE